MASGKRRRPPPVIDLDATEIARAPVPAEPQAETATPPEAVAVIEPTLEPPAPEPVPVIEPSLEPPPQPEFQSPPPPEPPAEPLRAETNPEPSEPSPVAEPPPDVRRMPWALIGAGAAGAGGALLAVLLLWALGFGATSREPSDALTPRLASIETQLRELAARPAAPAVDSKALDALSARLGKVESAASAPRPATAATTDPAVASRLAGTETAVKTLNDNVAGLAKRTDEVGQHTDDLIAALRDERGQMSKLATSLTELQSATRQAAAGSDRTVRLAFAASALRTAVERGEPFGAELATAKGLTKDAGLLAPLDSFATTGVPGNAALARELSALIPPMRDAVAAMTPRDSGILDRLQANAEKLVRIRRVGEATPGDDPAAVVARIETKAAQSDIAGALSEFSKLPAPVRALAQDWIARAQARGRALDASRQFAAGAIAGLNATP